jgi:hypothetical protein
MEGRNVQLPWGQEEIQLSAYRPLCRASHRALERLITSHPLDAPCFLCYTFLAHVCKGSS